jgi:SAM-dependent methyltransferase
MSAASVLFDRKAHALRRRRAARLAALGQQPRADFLLARVAEDFADRLSVIRRSFSDLIDLGCHDGLIGRTLTRDRTFASVISADECADRAASAPGMPLCIDLEHLPFAPESADLIVSGLVLHTVNDLPGVLAQICRTLRPDGLFLGALIGGRSLAELRETLVAAELQLRGGASPRVAPAIDVRDLGTLLQRAGFALPVVDSDVVTVTYAHPLALMGDLRAMAATNVLIERPRTPLRRDVLALAIELYQQRFANPDGRIRATFEILTATAWAPHASQQQPLKPGSATTRLADALKSGRT